MKFDHFISENFSTFDDLYRASYPDRKERIAKIERDFKGVNIDPSGSLYHEINGRDINSLSGLLLRIESKCKKLGWESARLSVQLGVWDDSNPMVILTTTKRETQEEREAKLEASRQENLRIAKEQSRVARERDLATLARLKAKYESE